MVFVLDNYDSFTYNLVQYLGELGASVVVYRNDEVSPADVLAARPDAIVLSPGPCTPKDAGVCIDLIKAADGKAPILWLAGTTPADYSHDITQLVSQVKSTS